MGRLLLLLLFVVSWTAAEAWEKKRPGFKADHMWKSLNEWIPKWLDLPKNYTGDRSKIKATGCGDCAKAVTSFRVKDNANHGRENGTSTEGPNVVHKHTTEHFARDLLTTVRQKATDFVLRVKGDKKIVEKNLIPSHKVEPSHVTSKPCVDKKTSIVKIRVLEDKAVVPPTTLEEKIGPSRQHKAFFMNYLSSQRVYQGKEAKQVVPKTAKKQRQKQKQKPGKHKTESDIYFIRLPPTPYSYVPGLGYVSQPATFSTSSLAAAGEEPQRRRKPQSPFIKLPLEFVSNGKPTAVYRWSPSTSSGAHHHHHQHQQQHNRRPPAKGDSTVIKLNRGPYVFDGRPMSVYLMKRDPNPPAPNVV